MIGLALALALQDGFVPLFDGKTLSGWKQLNGKAAYAVEDGAVVGSTVLKEPNSFLCTEKLYGDFILELEFKVDPTLNSGIQIRSNSFPELNKGRVHGYQCEIDPSDRAWSAGIYDEGRRGWLNDLKDNEPARKAFKQSEWNAVRVECVGDSIKTWLNGVAAADLVDSMTLTGFISLQVHSAKEAGLQVRWRNIRIKEMGRHVWKPLFDGKSLAGWSPVGGGTWEVKDGAIVGTSGAEAGSLSSEKASGDFTMRIVTKALKGDSRLFFGFNRADLPVSRLFDEKIEPLKGADGLTETIGHGWFAVPGSDQIMKWYKPGEWNEITVSARGKRVVVHVNGTKAADVKNNPGLVAVPLSLELHGGRKTQVAFKSIEMLTRE